jgi:hypothetical protein
MSEKTGNKINLNLLANFVWFCFALIIFYPNIWLGDFKNLN